MRKHRGVVVKGTPIRPVTFVCPYCGVDRAGHIMDLQRWYRVGPVAVVPLAQLDPMVECATCHARSGIAVLNVPTASMLTDILFQGMRHAVAAVCRASQDTFGALDRGVEVRAVDVMRAAGFDYDILALEADMANTHDEGTSAHLRLLADELTPHGKQSLLHRLHAIAAVAGPISPLQYKILDRAGTALGMAAPHVQGVLAVARQEPSTSDAA